MAETGSSLVRFEDFLTDAGSGDVMAGEEDVPVPGETDQQQTVCGEHHERLDTYCHTDQTCVCAACALRDHAGHVTLPIAAEWAARQKQLDETMNLYKQQIEKDEMKLEELNEAVESHQRSTRAALEQADEVCEEMIRYVEDNRSAVIQMIREQEKAAVRQAETSMRELEQEIEGLRRVHEQLEQMSDTDDHSTFHRG